MRIRVRALAVTVTLILLAAVLLLPTGVLQAQETAKKPVIGLVMRSLVTSYDAGMKAGVEDAAKEWNLDVMVVDGAGDAATQAAGVERLVSSGVNAILVDPINPQVLTAPVKSALKAGIPVVALGRNTVAVDGVIHVNTNNRMIGRKAFEVLAGGLTGEAAVLEVVEKGVPESKDRSGGFGAAVKEQNRIVVAATIEARDRQEASALVQQALKDSGPVQAVFAHTAELAVGAVVAFNLVSPNAPLVVVGVGGGNDVLKLIKLGKMNATVYEKPWDIGHIAAETALRILKGGKPAKFIPVDVVVFPTP